MGALARDRDFRSITVRLESSAVEDSYPRTRLH